MKDCGGTASLLAGGPVVAGHQDAGQILFFSGGVGVGFTGL